MTIKLTYSSRHKELDMVLPLKIVINFPREPLIQWVPVEIRTKLMCRCLAKCFACHPLPCFKTGGHIEINPFGPCSPDPHLDLRGAWDKSVLMFV